MPGNLEGVLAKIERAHVNLALFESEQSAWFGTKPFAIHAETNRELSSDITNIFFVVTSAEPVPLRFNAIIGDILYDLRSALDHLANQLVVANGGQVRKTTKFPIVERRPKHPISVPGVHARALALSRAGSHTVSRSTIPCGF